MILLIAIVIGAIVGGAASGEGGALAGALFGWLILRSLRQQKEIESLRGQSIARAVTETTSLQQSTEKRRLPSARRRRRRKRRHRWQRATSQCLHRSRLRRSRRPPSRQRRSRLPKQRPRSPAKRRWPRRAATCSRRSSAGCSVATRSSRPASASSSSASRSSPSTRASTRICRSRCGWRRSAPRRCVLLGIGWRLRLKRPDYAQVLQGGAVAVMYLTLFAAFRYYGVLAALPAFVLMVAVAALAAALAVLQDARALAVIGALGGFATPLIVSTGSEQPRRPVHLLPRPRSRHRRSSPGRRPGACSTSSASSRTFIVATAWGVLKYRPENFATSQAFLVAFFLLFVVILVLPARRLGGASAQGSGASRRDAWVNSSLLFGLPTVTFALQYGLVGDTPFGAALVGARARRLLCLARDVDENRARARPHLRRDARDRDRLPDARHPVRARRAQHRRRLGARRRGPGLDRLSPAAPAAARVRLSAAVRSPALPCCSATSATAHRRCSSTPISSTRLMAAAASLAAAFFVHRSRAALAIGEEACRAGADRAGDALAGRRPRRSRSTASFPAGSRSPRGWLRSAPSPRCTRGLRRGATGVRSPGRRSPMRRCFS